MFGHRAYTVCDSIRYSLITGYQGGSCVKFEMKIRKELLRLQCRHHILELVLGHVCEKLLGKSNTPHFSFYGSNEIKTKWEQLEKSQYEPIDEEKFERSPILLSLRNEAVEQIQQDVRSENIRDDYLELNDVCLKLLGIGTSRKIRVLGAIGNARWISKVLFIAKIYLFRGQLSLREDILNILDRIVTFVCLLYVKNWNQATKAVNAAINDFQFIKQLEIYSSYDREVSEVAIRQLGDHLWYLGGELVTLSLFSNKVSLKIRIEKKVEISFFVQNML